jgi:hypothetical protein
VAFFIFLRRRGSIRPFREFTISPEHDGNVVKSVRKFHRIGENPSLQPSPVKEPPMAKKRGKKSKAIREYMTANPNAKAKEIVEALASKGLKVTANLVYYLMGQVKSSTNQQTKRQASQARVTAVEGDLVQLIQEVRSLAKKAGGYGKLKELVDALAG